MRAAARQSRVVRDFEIDSQQPKEGSEEALQLAQWQVEHKPQRQGGPYRQVGELGLGSPASSWLCLPCVEGIGGQPNRHVASLHKSAFVLTPVGDAVAGLELRVDA